MFNIQFGKFITFITMAMFALLMAVPALAGFKVCNETTVAQAVSVAYRGQAGWISEGWWTVQPATCETVKGGNLNVPYYYYRTYAKGREFKGGGYMFCTDTKAFTIIGNTECSARGFQRESFSEVEIGEGVTDFTLTMAQGPQTATPQPPKEETGGDPFSVSGVFQGCATEDSRYYCAFHSEGRKWYVYQDTGTAAGPMAALKALQAGGLADFSGEVLSLGDISVSVLLRTVVAHGPRTEAENLIAGLQGRWRNVQDPASMMILYGGESFEYYGSELMEVSHVQFSDTCAGSNGAGPVLIKQVPGEPEAFCFVVLGWDATSLQLSYVGGLGANDQSYEKVP